MPFSEALSRALIARRTSSEPCVPSGVPPSLRARLTSVFTAERVARLRSRLRIDARTRFFAERVFATRRLIIPKPD
jgi:hypothetical protein